MVHTDIWKSKQVSWLSLQARLLFIGLISLGDDDGRLRGDPVLLRSEIFPRDESVTVADVRGWLGEVVSAGLVVLYTVDDEDYLAHPNWTKYQSLRADRKKDSSIPLPPDNLLTTVLQPTDNQLATTTPQPADTRLLEGKVSKGKVRQDKILAQTEFEQFWSEYPRKIAKQNALKSWNKIAPTPELAQKIIFSVSVQKTTPQWKKDGGQFIPHPATWLNQGRWEDEVTADTGRRKVDKF